MHDELVEERIAVSVTTCNPIFEHQRLVVQRSAGRGMASGNTDRLRQYWGVHPQSGLYNLFYWKPLCKWNCYSLFDRKVVISIHFPLLPPNPSLLVSNQHIQRPVKIYDI